MRLFRKPSYYDPLALELLGFSAVPIGVVVAAIIAIAILFSGCVGALKGGTFPSGPKQTVRPISFHLCVPNASIDIDGALVAPQSGTTDAQGTWTVPAVSSLVSSLNLHVRKDGAILPYLPVVALPADASNHSIFVKGCETAAAEMYPPGVAIALDSAPVSLHVDPSTFTLEQLSHIRGAMWTARLNLPFGPFPNTDQNSIAFDFYSFYGKPDRQRMIAAYKSRGYTHVVTGPVSGTDCYHNQWPCHDQRFPAWMPVDGPPSQGQWDAYLDDVQELWDAGLTPVFFAKPDGWEGHLDWLDQLDALFAQPRAQRLLRVVVYPGWEPSGSKYGWDNDTWLYFVQRGARVFPNALLGLHTPADLDAPTGGEDENRGYTNGQTWRLVAPYIHLWLSQWGGYVFSSDCTPSDSFKNELAGALSDSVGRFKTGKAGWPVDSAWGAGQPVRVVAAEYASYIYFGKGCGEGPSLDLGDIAVKAGVAGYLDGGRLAVP